MLIRKQSEIYYAYKNPKYLGASLLLRYEEEYIVATAETNGAHVLPKYTNSLETECFIF